MFICQRIIVSCFFVPENQSQVRDAFLHINSSDSGEITHKELAKAFPILSYHEIKAMIENCSHSHPDRIKWSEFQVACNPIQNPHQSNLEKKPNEIALFTLFMHRVFGYLNVYNQSDDYLIPKDLLYVLKSQAFRFSHIDLKSCIYETFKLEKESDWFQK